MLGLYSFSRVPLNLSNKTWAPFKSLIKLPSLNHMSSQSTLRFHSQSIISDLNFIIHFNRFAARPPTLHQLPYTIEKALRTAFYGKPGATYVDLVSYTSWSRWRPLSCGLLTRNCVRESGNCSPPTTFKVPFKQTN